MSKVLILDDSNVSLKLRAEPLLSRAHAVIEAHDVDECVQLAKRDQPDVIVANASMSVVAGLNWCKTIVASETTANIPIVFAAEIATDEQVVEALNAGVHHYLVGPFCAARFVAQVESAARSHERFRVAQEAARPRASHETHDALTGLIGRKAFSKLLSKAIAFAGRNDQKIAALFIDIDQFKPFTNTLGTDIADALLRSIAIRIQECVGSRDVVARVSSDEFMILLHEVCWVGNPAAVADRVGKRISEPHVIQGHELQLTASIGIAIYPEDGVTADELTGHSDLAMSDAKAQGRGKCCFFTKSMNETAREEIHIEQGLRQAMDRDEFSLRYQAQVDGTTGELVGAEALLRWEGPDGEGGISPATFIPLAESVGLIHEIGSWVLREACRQKRVWEDEELGDFPISINISPKQIAEPGFVEKVEGILRDTGLRSDRVILEVTESTIMVDSSDAAQTFSELRSKGVRIAVDDFGTGYSSMRLLDRLPFDVLKIDRCFVEEIENNPKRQAFATSIVALAKSLDLETVTEGVETEAELNFLLGIGCRTIQGYFVGMPMSPMEFAISFMQRPERKPEE